MSLKLEHIAPLKHVKKAKETPKACDQDQKVKGELHINTDKPVDGFSIIQAIKDAKFEAQKPDKPCDKKDAKQDAPKEDTTPSVATDKDQMMKQELKNLDDEIAKKRQELEDLAKKQSEAEKPKPKPKIEKVAAPPKKESTCSKKAAAHTIEISKSKASTSKDD